MITTPIKHIDYNRHTSGSLGEITRDAIGYLESKGWVCRDNFTGAPVYFMHYLNNMIVNDSRYKAYKKRVLIQPIDGQRLKKVFVGDINKHDVVLTPASMGKKFMEDSGVTAPIHVVPNYFVEEDIKFDPLVLAQMSMGTTYAKKSDKYTFYHESTLTERKNALPLLKSFLLAFSDKPEVAQVRLVVKGVPRMDTQVLRDEMKRYATKFRKTPVIELHTFELNKEALKPLWHNADAYVSFAHMEGFGIPLLRMAVMGKPIATLNSTISGYMDFLSEETAYLVPAKMVPMGCKEDLLFDMEGTEWEDVESLEAAAEQLRMVFEERNSPKLVPESVYNDYRKEVVMKKYEQFLQV